MKKWKLKLSVCLAIVAMIIAGIFLTAKEEPQAKAPIPARLVVKALCANCPITTEPLSINNSWMVRWTHRPDSPNGLGLLVILVYDAENPNFPMAIIVNSTEKDSGESYIRESGTFFLDIYSVGSAWTILAYLSEE